MNNYDIKDSGTNIASSRKLLQDVCIIRFILIFLLVLYHAFAIFCGAWAPLDGYPEIRSYWWIGKASYSFMLEAFVFISGYVFGYQVLRKPEKLAFNSVATNKAKRLLLPSIIFSVIYYCFFYDFHKPIYEICYSIINGAGHLWFLPMLFWCFIFTSLAEKTGINRRCVTAIAIALSFVSVVPLPFRLSSALYYFVFFYVGYMLKRYDLNADKSVSRKNTILSVLAYIVIFTGLTAYLDRGGVDIHLSGNVMIDKGIVSLVRTAGKLAIGISGVTALYMTVNYFLKRKGVLSHYIVDFSAYCFGIYIFQQFILKYLYYYTELPHVVSPAILPWIGFAAALTGSYLLTYLMRRASIGRNLIG